MAKSSLPSLMSFVTVLLFILACSSIQINIQINTNLTSTSGTDAFQEVPTQTAFLSPPSVTSVPLTVTITPTPEPMPHLAPGQSVQISDLIMLAGTTGWGFVPYTSKGLSQIQRTSDRGMTWVTIKKVAWQSARFDFVDEQVGWATVTNGTNALLLKTVDGGRTWAPLAPLIE